MTQPELFDKQQVTDTVCPVPGCQAIRFAGQQRAPTCRHDRDQALGNYGRRPKQCVNTIDPATSPWPDGF